MSPSFERLHKQMNWSDGLATRASGRSVAAVGSDDNSANSWQLMSMAKMAMRWQHHNCHLFILNAVGGGVSARMRRALSKLTTIVGN